MVQKFHVLKCFKCDTFQVQMVKKSNKWECKVCSIKQSVQQIYGDGSAKDCRLHVQKLNGMRAFTDCNIPTVTQEVLVEKHDSPSSSTLGNKWSKYIEDTPEENMVKDEPQISNHSNNNYKRKNEFIDSRERKKHIISSTTYSEINYMQSNTSRELKDQFCDTSNIGKEEYVETNKPLTKDIYNERISNESKWTKYLDKSKEQLECVDSPYEDESNINSINVQNPIVHIKKENINSNNKWLKYLDESEMEEREEVVDDANELKPDSKEQGYEENGKRLFNNDDCDLDEIFNI